MLDYKYAYLVGNIILLPIWIILFIHRKDLRKEIVLVGLAAGVIAIFTSHLFLADFWEPEYTFPIIFRGKVVSGFNEFLYGFIGAGIASSIYEEIFGKRFAKRRDRKHNWRYFLIPFIVACMFILFTFNLLLGINSIYAAFLAILIPLVGGLFFRRDLIIDSIYSGLIFGLISILMFLILTKIFPGLVQRWWRLGNVSGVLILGIPAEELMWAFIFGAGSGPFYEFFTGRRLVGMGK